ASTPPRHGSGHIPATRHYGRQQTPLPRLHPHPHGAHRQTCHPEPEHLTSKTRRTQHATPRQIGRLHRSREHVRVLHTRHPPAHTPHTRAQATQRIPGRAHQVEPRLRCPRRDRSGNRALVPRRQHTHTPRRRRRNYRVTTRHPL